MTVPVGEHEHETVSEGTVVEREAAIEEQATPSRNVTMQNHWLTSMFAAIIWGIITVMNVALLVLLGLGKV
jgi:metal iron transporter